MASYRYYDLGEHQMMRRRAVVNAEDDLFDNATLDAKWLAYTNNDPTTDLKALPGWMKIGPCGWKLQAAPAGDYTIETEVVLGDITAAGYENFGICLTDGTNYNTSHQAPCGIGMNNNMQQYRLVFEHLQNAGFIGTYSQWTTDSQVDRMFLRIVKVGTTYAAEWSTTGKSWRRWGSTSALGFTPTYIGVGGNTALGAGATAYFNSFYRY